MQHDIQSVRLHNFNLKQVSTILFSCLRIFLILFICSQTTDVSAQQRLDSLLNELDITIANQKQYNEKKENGIEILKKKLKSTKITLDQRLTIHNSLYQEYASYICDSAIHYARLNLKIANQIQNVLWINQSELQLARVLASSGLFSESYEMLKGINKKDLTKEQLSEYYSCYSETYFHWGEYKGDDVDEHYSALRKLYQDSALAVISPSTYAYAVNFGRKCIEENDYKNAAKNLLPYLSQIEENTRDYSILTNLVANIYRLNNQPELEKEYLALSALSDLKASIKENISLRDLAVLLLNSGDINRSNQYIKCSMEDANFYNARLRNIQIAKMLPIIDKAYQLKTEKQQNILVVLLIIISLLSIFLLMLIFKIVRQMRKLSIARNEVVLMNNQLKMVNASLSEANHIKEEYIGRFLNQCSLYIEKLENYRRSLNKKASSGKVEELYTMLKSSQFIDEELTDFYHNFDTTFLNIFPDFVAQFNELLQESERFPSKLGNRLTTELRIFALIRLGITDSAKIAALLRYSITTIYNYRSKYRNKAIVPKEEFEPLIMKIGSHKM